MPTHKAPGIHVGEAKGPSAIEGVPTSIAAFLGVTETGPNEPCEIASVAEFERTFGTSSPYLNDAVRGFFANGGRRPFICRLAPDGGEPTAEDLRVGLSALTADACRDVGLVAAPGLTGPSFADALCDHCEASRARFAVLDSPRDVADPATLDPRSQRASSFAAFYHPWLEVAGSSGARKCVPPSGHLMGIYARVDAQRGVWKAPANEAVRGAIDLTQKIDNRVQDLLNPRGVNLIRQFAGRGILVWGARTLGDDPEWKYVSVRRLFIFLEQSIHRGTQWVVFEPNGEPLWTEVRSRIEQFLLSQWRAGALIGDKPERAFFVRCDRRTMTQADIDSGRLVVEIGVAPMRPAEFVIFRLFQWTADRDDDD